MAVSSEFFAARVNDSVVRLDDSVEPKEFKALLHFIYHGEMRGDLRVERERMEDLGRSLGVPWFPEDGRTSRKRHRSRTPSPASNEDAEDHENELTVSEKGAKTPRKGRKESHDCKKCGEAFDSMKTLMDHLFTHTPVKTSSSKAPGTGGRGRPRPALRKTKSFNPLARENVVEETLADNSNSAAPSNENKDCRICKKSFKHFGHLFNHMRKFHPNREGEERSEDLQVDTKSAEETQPENEGESHDLSNMDEAAISDKEDEAEEMEDGATSILNDSMMDSTTDLTTLPRKTKEGYVCPVCQKAYKQRQTLKVHIDGKHRGITLDCKHCDKKFKSPSALYQHVRKMHGESTGQDQVLAAIGQEEVEAAINDTDEMMQQGDMSADATVNETLNRSANHECPECQKGFKSKQTLKVHIDGQHRGITHDCQLCDKKFKYAHQLKLHVKKKHGDIDEQEPLTATKKPATAERGECGVCGERVPNLAKHMRKYHEGIVVDPAGQALHNCGDCDTNFNTDVDLDAHRITYHT